MLTFFIRFEGEGNSTSKEIGNTTKGTQVTFEFGIKEDLGKRQQKRERREMKRKKKKKKKKREKKERKKKKKRKKRKKEKKKKKRREKGKRRKTKKKRICRSEVAFLSKSKLITLAWTAPDWFVS